MFKRGQKIPKSTNRQVAMFLSWRAPPHNSGRVISLWVNNAAMQFHQNVQWIWQPPASTQPSCLTQDTHYGFTFPGRALQNGPKRAEVHLVCSRDPRPQPDPRNKDFSFTVRAGDVEEDPPAVRVNLSALNWRCFGRAVSKNTGVQIQLVIYLN